MKNNLIKIYALAVCFVTILCIAITTGFALYGIAVYVSPELGLDSRTYAAYQSNDAFRSSRFYFSTFGPKGIRIGTRSSTPGVETPIPEPIIVAVGPEGLISSSITREYDSDKIFAMSDEEVEEIRLRQYVEILSTEKFDTLRSLLRYMIILTVSSVVFFIHWRIAR